MSSGTLVGTLVTFSTSATVTNDLNDLNQNFTDIKTVVNGQLGVANMAADFYASELGGTLSSAQRNNALGYVIRKTGSMAVTTATGSFGAVKEWNFGSALNAADTITFSSAFSNSNWISKVNMTAKPEGGHNLYVEAALIAGGVSSQTVYVTATFDTTGFSAWSVVPTWNYITIGY